MGFIWFWIVAVMLAAYVVLDGFDLGVGILHPVLARSESDRQIMLRSIGPVWDGNEVWLLAGGGTLYFAFPALYAAAFSGFYLALMIVLWLLILRGASIELRVHIDDPLWRSFFDALFFLSSALLAVFFGAALANVIPHFGDISGAMFIVCFHMDIMPGAGGRLKGCFWQFVMVFFCLISYNRRR
jgi:cytochrome d ubiquinol oxidase subunit II